MDNKNLRFWQIMPLQALNLGELWISKHDHGFSERFTQCNLFYQHINFFY